MIDFLAPWHVHAVQDRQQHTAVTAGVLSLGLLTGGCGARDVGSLDTAGAAGETGDGPPLGDVPDDPASCGAVKAPWRGFSLTWLEISVGAGSTVSDAVCIIDTAETLGASSTLTLDCTWGLNATGRALILWPRQIPDSLESGSEVRLYGADTRALRVAEPSGELLFAGVDERPSLIAEVFESEFEVTMARGACPPVAGSCFAENFLGELDVRQNGEAAVVLGPFDGARAGDYAITTGALVLSNPESAYECDGPNDDAAQIQMTRRY